MNYEALDTFVRKVMGMNVSGEAAGVFGANGTAVQIMQQLKQTVNVFANCYKDTETGPDPVLLNDLAKEAAGFIQMLQTLSVIPADQANQLLTEMQSLMNNLVVPSANPNPAPTPY